MAYLNVDELRDEYTDLREAEERDEDEDERLEYLTALLDALGSDKPDTLIPEEDFERHVREESEDSVPARWLPYINWDEYVHDARSDYTEIDVNGDTFLYLA